MLYVATLLAHGSRRLPVPAAAGVAPFEGSPRRTGSTAEFSSLQHGVELHRGLSS